MSSPIKQTEEWEKEPEFEALQECCVKGGADKRALPQYIRAIRSRLFDELLSDELMKEEKVITLGNIVRNHLRHSFRHLLEQKKGEK